ncbi:MAG TPA: hypothetical protein PK673_06460 [Paludibacteraceae bacterium]|nr:hypothetical protein [Paludibacteraceae bacterium]
MFEKNIIVQLGDDRNRKYAEIFCETQAEMQTIDTGNYVAGTKAYIVQTGKTYFLDKPTGKWYDSAGASLYGLNSAIGTITKTLTKITANGSTTAYYGNQVVVYLTPADGYGLPATIVVKIGEATGEADTDYTYDDATGIITIPAAKVTDAITITAAGVALSQGKIDFTLTDITVEGDDEAFYETEVEFTLTAATNYVLPTTIEVTINGVTGVVTEDYTYNSTTGVVVITAASVLGAVEVVATAVGESQGNITYTLTNLTNTGDVSALYGTEVNATLIADQYYVLPETIDVTVDGVQLTSGDDYVYDNVTGEVVVFSDSVTGAIAIIATGTAAEYGNITLALTNITATGDTTATYGEDIDVVLAAGDGYDLPTTITITINAVEATIVTDYTYSAETGAVHIAGAKVVGAVVITAVGSAQG